MTDDRTQAGLVWARTLGLSGNFPEILAVAVGLVATYVTVVVPATVVFSFLERKLSADLQARVGPNRAGPVGIFQTFADLLKLLQKGTGAERSSSWLLLQTVAIYSSLSVIPTSSGTLLIDADMSVFMPLLAVFLMAVLGLLMGVESRTINGLHGGLRGIVQAVAGLFPALISILAVGLVVGGYRWTQIADAQGASPFRWLMVREPFLFISFFTFVISGLVMLQSPPLDGAGSAVDLRGGIGAGLKGHRLSLFRASRLYGHFLWSCISVVLFLGAWKLPASVSSALKVGDREALLHILEATTLLVKTLGLMLLVVVVGRVTPRLRADQVADLSWKVLSPLALAALMGSALWTTWGLS
jgi:NADH-quinone oxidoreductase subunit H